MSKKNKQPQLNTPVQVVQQSMSFSGPLPHPAILAKYNEILPGAADRIIQMAEKQSAHRQSLENLAITSDVNRSKYGQILGFVIAVAGLIVTCILGVYGSAVAAGIMGASTLGSLVGIFVVGTNSRKNERAEKSK